jgi:hypothetical protein
VRPDFTIATETVSRIARPGERVVVRVSIVRRNSWTGPVALTLDGQPAGASVGFLPNNPTPDQTSDLHVLLAPGTPLGESTLRISGRAGDVVRETALQLRVVGDERVNLTIASGGALAPGTTGRFGELEATVTNGPGPVTLSAEGLPAGISLSVGQNPVIGRTPLLATVASTVVPGFYSFTIVGSTPLASARVTATVVVTLTPGNTTLVFPVTPVAAVPGDPVSYGIAASAGSVTVPRGTSAQLLLTITPRGGFTGNLTIDVSGLPTPVMASLEPTGTPNVVRVTLTAPSTALPVAATLTLRAQSGSLSAAVTVGLIVT